MAFQNKDLQVGDLLLSKIGEVYCYLDFFIGEPCSLYSVPNCGHMYLFCDSLFSLKSHICNTAEVNEAVRHLEEEGVEFAPAVSLSILQKNWSRLRSSFDGNARYSKSYGRFVRRVGHVDITDRETFLKYVYGCMRLGDKSRGSIRCDFRQHSNEKGS